MAQTQAILQIHKNIDCARRNEAAAKHKETNDAACGACNPTSLSTLTKLVLMITPNRMPSVIWVCYVLAPVLSPQAAGMLAAHCLPSHLSQV